MDWAESKGFPTASFSAPGCSILRPYMVIPFHGDHVAPCTLASNGSLRSILCLMYALPLGLTKNKLLMPKARSGTRISRANSL